MISTRDNLLVRPWQQRKYDYHKKKVLNATSVIDTKSPPHRGHVTVKLKKLQTENERSRKIERDNLILLQKLNHIMTTHWLDNYLPPQPNFLNRIGVYRPVIGADSDINDDDFSTILIDQEIDEQTSPSDSRKCKACFPQKNVAISMPEGRIPWEPQKKEVAGKRRSISVPPKCSRSSQVEKPKSASVFCEKTSTKTTDFLKKSANSISISRGSLKLSVNFPRDSDVKFDKKILADVRCKCSRNLR